MPDRIPLLGAGIAATALLLASSTPRADTAEDSYCRRDAMIVFDTSGSMQIREERFLSRLDIARSALQRLLPEITSQRRTGLIVFGAQENCSVELRLRLARGAGGAISSQLDGLLPGAQTPIVRAVEQATVELRGRGIVVVVTDGEETCGGDPCSLGQRLQSIAPDLVVHVIGYRLPSKANAKAKCLAEATAGKFVTVNAESELVQALSEALLCPKVSWWRAGQPALRMRP
jgi:Ca-activated chloride channel family protein